MWYIIPNRGDIIKSTPHNLKLTLKTTQWCIPVFGPYPTEESAISEFDDLMDRYCINKEVRKKWNLVMKS